MRLRLLSGRLAVCRLAPDDPFPAWATGGGFWSVTRSDDELSVICSEERVPGGIRREPGWRALELQGPFDFTEVGVLLPIAETLARAGISMLPLATHDTDYVLVKEERLASATERLEAAGHSVAGA